MFGRYMATRDKKPSAFAKTGNVLTTTNPHIDNLAQSFTARRHEGVRQPTASTMLRFAFNRTAVNRDNDPYFDPHDLGINVNSYVPHQMIVVVTGGFNIAAATATRGIADNNSFQVNDDLAVVRGNHQFGFGVNVARFRRRSEDLGARRRPVELHGAGVGPGACGLPARACRDPRSIRPVRRRVRPVVQRRVRTGHVASRRTA